MSDLKEMFEYRLSKYRQTTDKILKSLSNVTEGVLQTLAEDESSTLHWEDIQYEPGSNLLILIGVIQLAVGENVQLEDGRVLNVTEKNVDTFKRIIRVGVPFDLAENGSVEEVADFFEGKKQSNYTTLDDIVDALIEDDDEDFETVNDLQRNAITSILGFDVKDLSDEQVQQIIDNIDEGNIH